MTAVDDICDRRIPEFRPVPTSNDSSPTSSAVGLPGVTLVLPTRDRAEMVHDAVQSVLAGEVVPDEIVVVDQGGSSLLDRLDGTSFGGCVVRVEPCSPGLSRAVNHGARIGRHEVLAVVHDDVLVEPDWLHRLVGTLAARGPGAVVTGRVAATDPERPGAFAPSLRDDPTPAVYRGRIDRCVIRPMNIALWRRDHLAIGGFDERLGPGTPFPGGEDHDYSARLLDAGFEVHYLPDALVRHRAWRDRSEFLPLHWRYGLAHGAFYARSYDPADRRVLERVGSDVRRRLRLVPSALVSRPREGLGHLLFLSASAVGAVRWRSRYRATAAVPALLGRPIIEPVPATVERPRWSVMVPTHNCAQFLGVTLSSVLEQDPGRDLMQIEVVDDHSTKDEPFDVVRDLGGDRVGFHRHEVNRGNIATFNTCLARSVGEYVHILHGDDRVFPGFYDRLGRALDDNPECVAAICGHLLIDEEGEPTHVMPRLAGSAGVLEGFFERLLGGNLIQAPSIVVRRDAYEAVGGYDSRISTYAEDWEMWTRLAALGPVWYDPAVLAAYRLRIGSITSSTVSTTKSLEDLVRVIAINRESADRLLPPDVARRRSAAARRWAAEMTAKRALRRVDRGHGGAALQLMSAAVSVSRSPSVLAHVPAMPVRWSARRIAILQGRVTPDGTGCDS